MIGRLRREERGMVLGLAIIVVVIVGVMGAGFPTFVATDLRTAWKSTGESRPSNWQKRGSRSPRHASTRTRVRPTGPRENSIGRHRR
jgi:hypothetical protein